MSSDPASALRISVSQGPVRSAAEAVSIEYVGSWPSLVATWSTIPRVPRQTTSDITPMSACFAQDFLFGYRGLARCLQLVCRRRETIALARFPQHAQALALGGSCQPAGQRGRLAEVAELLD